MSPAHLAVILLSLLSVLTTAIGVLLAGLIQNDTRAIAGGIGFSVGIMMLVSLLDLLPDARAAVGMTRTGLATLLGTATLWLANFAIPHSHLVFEHGLDDTRLVRSVYLVVIGLILHDVPEGFAMANAYLASPSLSLLAALSIALHNLPEELAMAVPALALKSQRFLLVAAVLSALAEPVGAVIGLLAGEAIPGLNADMMAFAAGAMIFFSLHELVPMVRRYGHLGWFVGGVSLSALAHAALARITGA